ncbi:tetratricopeptide repeat protein [Kitasatospora sp. NPDC052868]|uniref:tetratricopeptide repeat protein n=1 Tax=Kitasatospora sp. NPDC052868 TaxID=3364060 RepID=UPI0037C77E0E
MDERIEQAGLLCERAVFGGEDGVLEAAEGQLDAVEADLALARGRLIHARFLEQRVGDARELELFERAARLYRELGDGRGEGEALLWTGIYHQVVGGDNDTAVPVLERAHALAAQAGDRLTVSYVLRHLGIAAHMAGRLGAARERLEESARLRRELDFPAGVAANLVGLAYIAAAEDRREDARGLLEEAAALAGAADAKAVLRSVDEARGNL